jgi:hypothetical protein
MAVDVFREDRVHVVGRRDRVPRFWIPAPQLQCRDMVELSGLQLSETLAAGRTQAVLPEDDLELHQVRDCPAETFRRGEGKLSEHLLFLFAFKQTVKRFFRPSTALFQAAIPS